MLGVLSTSNGYYGSFGAHHTAEDNLDGLRTYDPGMREAVVTAQVTGIQAMRRPTPRYNRCASKKYQRRCSKT